ncbi:MAG: FKBP-type peptidyl-prolyl cis-trans isomerase [Proteobacteria bacterium]|nr:FKBP-type peptidyl-prolyl cis-trans isomerase [Pseudomonadota bacterium]
MFRTGLLIVGALALFTVAAQAADPALSPEANAAYLKANAAKPGVVVEPSGLQYSIIKSGYGKRPGPRDSVTVYYKGQLINGTTFDATEPGFPAQFTVNRLIPGWTEALMLMREGDHWQLVIPANLAYGPAGNGPIPPNQTLVFDLELLKDAPPPPKQPGQDDDSHPGPGAS